MNPKVKSLTPETARSFWPGGKVRPRPRPDKRGHYSTEYRVVRFAYMKAAHAAGYSAKAIADSLRVSRALVEFLLSGRKKNRTVKS